MRNIDKFLFKTTIGKCAAVVAFLMAWTVPAWAQTPPPPSPGLYYIANYHDSNPHYNPSTIATNYYMVPASICGGEGVLDEQWALKEGSTYNHDKPLLTTYQTSMDTNQSYDCEPDFNSIWEISTVTVVENNIDVTYYRIKHWLTGKYVVYNNPDNTNRRAFHLESADDPSTFEGKDLFEISYVNNTDVSGVNAYSIRYKALTSSHRFMNPAKGNRNFYYGLRFPVDNGPFIAGLMGVYNSDTDNGSKWFFEPATVTIAQPTITFDNTTNTVSIDCTTASATIYYTIDGGTQNAYNGTGGTGPFVQNTPATIRAYASFNGVSSTEVEYNLQKVATPTIEDNGNNAISITCTTEDATIYYTTDGSTPVVGSSAIYTVPLTENVSGVTIKAIAVKENMINSAMGSGLVTLRCAAPVIRNDGEGFMVICNYPSSGVIIYYAIADGHGTPAMPTTSSSSTASGVHVDLPAGHSLPVTIAAIATAENYNNSEKTTTYLDALQELEGSGTLEDPYLIANQANVIPFSEKANSEAGASAYYKVTATDTLDFSVASSVTRTFTGHFDGNMVVLSGLEHPLFNVSNGANIKNVMLDNVSIGSGINVGAICGEATGASRIYNCGVLATSSTVETDKKGYTTIISCSSTICGTNYVGGIVGLLDGTSRVINCFSYANITSGAEVGGIVGHNNVATTSVASNQKTMVMNCMFYGDFEVDACDSIAPIYNGEIITNDGDENGVNNFNYFRSEASYVQNQDIDVYNCALAAETRFLQRFEFFRHLLNSNRTLAAWWVTGDRDKKDEMLKWVMEPSQIGTTTPYPILKTPDEYPSVVNFTPSNTPIDANNEHRNEGCKLGTLAVQIRMGSGGAVYGPPAGAEIINNDTILTITDKDPAHFNFNYGKVQLPYYNQVGTNNYRKASDDTSRVVTGWKIVTINGGTPGTYTVGPSNAPADYPAYNFADRKCTNKDLYGTDGSNRIFNQGAYWDVPEGVTAITIEPYWAKCVFLSDQYLDVVYKSGSFATNRPDAMKTASSVTTIGGGVHYTNGNEYNINNQNQKVYTTLAKATEALVPSTGTVYDNAIVLVGNYHHYNNSNNANIGNLSHSYTLMSADLDFDNEPDASLILRFNGRAKTHPVRYDFLNLIGLGMAQKVTGNDSNGTYNFGIMQPHGWFEVTNTALFRCTQFEYSYTSREKKPIILQGGVVEQWVTVQNVAGDKVEYFHVGGNVWFKEFHRGTHQDQDQGSGNDVSSTPHPPISVTGGDYDEFYLTGLYQPKATIYDDNAECYINGGRFGVMAGAGMEGIGKTVGKGNITWIIDNADINEFYGGGINASKPVFGNISTTISNSHVDSIFCGGPKFGDMQDGRTVTTIANNCTFKTFFGAGYGGNSYSRRAPYNRNNIINLPSASPFPVFNSWNAWVGDEYTQKYATAYGGVETQINYQFIPHSSNIDNVARLWIEYVGFSLATTHTVSSTLTGCTVIKNFYGGGSLGKVDVSVTSVLDGCKVKGNVYGAGFSVNVPSVEVMDLEGFETEPHYDEKAGVFLDHKYKESVTYEWEHRNTVNSTATAISTTNKKLYTTVDLETLGTVAGNVSLTIKGESIIGTDGDSNTGNVFGGGDQSAVTQSIVNGNPVPNTGNTTVILQEGAKVLGNVYGGGNEGPVGGDSQVKIQDE